MRKQADPCALVPKVPRHASGPNYFLSVRLYNDEIDKNVRAFQAALLEEDPELPRGCMTNPRSMHVTLAVLRVETPEAVAAVANELREHTPRIVEAAVAATGGNRIITLEGVDEFSRGRVVFATPKQVPLLSMISSGLKEVLGELEARLVAVGDDSFCVCERDRKFNAHATLAKLGRGKGKGKQKNNIAREHWQRAEAACAAAGGGAEEEDAAGAVRFCFGSAPLSTLHFSSMSHGSVDGWYRSPLSLPLDGSGKPRAGGGLLVAGADAGGLPGPLAARRRLQLAATAAEACPAAAVHAGRCPVAAVDASSLLLRAAPAPAVGASFTRVERVRLTDASAARLVAFAQASPDCTPELTDQLAAQLAVNTVRLPHAIDGVDPEAVAAGGALVALRVVGLLLPEVGDWEGELGFVASPLTPLQAAVFLENCPALCVQEAATGELRPGVSLVGAASCGSGTGCFLGGSQTEPVELADWRSRREFLWPAVAAGGAAVPPAAQRAVWFNGASGRCALVVFARPEAREAEGEPSPLRPDESVAMCAEQVLVEAAAEGEAAAVLAAHTRAQAQEHQLHAVEGCLESGAEGGGQ